MKRSFLHALALCFASGFVAGIFLIVTGHLIGGIAVSLLCMLISVWLLHTADRAPERNSSVLRLTGWLAGLAIGMSLLAVFIVL